jgi:hypothetical protein
MWQWRCFGVCAVEEKGQNENKRQDFGFGTDGKADEIVDPPDFRKMVDEVDRGTRSPLVNLQPCLKGEAEDENDDAAEASKLSS